MTQQNADEQPASPNQQRYVRISGTERYGSYELARAAAVQNFRLYSGEAFAPENGELTNEKVKVRVKRRVKDGKESFDVISYENIEHKKKMDKLAAEAAQEREGTKIKAEKKKT